MLDQELNIKSEFDKPSFSDWENITKDILKVNSEDLDKKLLFKSVEGFDLFPLHTKADWICELNSFPSSAKITDSTIHQSENIIDITKVHNAGASIVQEVFYGAYNFLQQMEKGITDIQIHISCDSLYFSNISKLRALRYIAEKLIEGSSQNTQFSITAHNSLREQTLFDPWVNMLRSTASSMAAVIGGANFVSSYSYDHLYTMYTGDKHSALGSRNAENELKILLEESHLDRVNDPMKGSYSIEHITNKIVSLAWEKLKAESESYDEKLFAEEVAQTANKRYELIRKRKVTVTGVNNFANPDETLSSLYKNSLDLNKVLGETNFPLRTVAFEFESLRDQFNRKENPVKIFICDNEAKVSARINFCKNYFEVLGADVSEASSISEISKNDHLIICATDDTYQEKLNDILDSLKTVSARGIYIAGKVDTDKLNNITDCLYMGQNIYKVLSRFVKEVC